MNLVLPVDSSLFSIISVFTIFCWSIMLVELYLITQSLLPVIILHTMGNSTLNPLVLEGYIQIARGKEIWISPIVGIIPALLCVLVGLLLRGYRIKNQLK